MIKRIRVSIKKVFASIALLSFELLTALVLFIGSLAVFAFLANMIFNLQNERFDFLVFDKVNGLVSTATTRFMQFITFFGSHQFLIPANLALVIYFLFIKKHK